MTVILSRLPLSRFAAALLVVAMGLLGLSSPASAESFDGQVCVNAGVIYPCVRTPIG